MKTTLNKKQYTLSAQEVQKQIQRIKVSESESCKINLLQLFHNLHSNENKVDHWKTYTGELRNVIFPMDEIYSLMLSNAKSDFQLTVQA